MLYAEWIHLFKHKYHVTDISWVSIIEIYNRILNLFLLLYIKILLQKFIQCIQTFCFNFGVLCLPSINERPISYQSPYNGLAYHGFVQQQI